MQASTEKPASLKSKLSFLKIMLSQEPRMASLFSSAEDLEKGTLNSNKLSQTVDDLLTWWTTNQQHLAKQKILDATRDFFVACKKVNHLKAVFKEIQDNAACRIALMPSENTELLALFLSDDGRYPEEALNNAIRANNLSTVGFLLGYSANPYVALVTA
ncbi:MAG: hypothetical protein K0Q74_1610, partial [Gammaproteobacteria bacterium]|nr:hypothetical protein [Gammaproteobacteria bacterium]